MRAKGMTQVAAYLECYDTKGNMNTIYKCASELENHPMIAPRIDELRKQFTENVGNQFKWDREQATTNLLQIYKMARKEIDYHHYTSGDIPQKSLRGALSCIQILNSIYGLAKLDRPHERLRDIIFIDDIPLDD